MNKKRIFFMLLAAVCAVGFSSCDLWIEDTGDTESIHSATEKKATVEKTENELVAIRVLAPDGEEMLADVMAYLQAENELAFSKDASGMLTGINGKENPADWSYCWMLYTSDAELSSSEWGSVEYAGQTLGSAVLGAESLPVAAGEVYVWVYTKF